MAQQQPITTIPPFNDGSKLPDCAKACGPLYDANGACVPPAIKTADSAVYTSCFCAQPKVAPFSKGTSGVCDNACDGVNGGLQSIAGWFQGICNVKNAGGNGAKTTTGATTTTSGQSASTGSSSKNSGGGGGGDWLSNHWQWVIMLVVLVVGIAGIWIGACIWRRRYLRKKDRQTSLGQKHSGSASRPSWGPAVTGSDAATPMNFAPDTERAAYAAEKPRKTKEKKKWTVSQRT
ncbi:integral membrane protein [Purpureocillium lilacinum]|uniref:Integral membrane protein n=1 Tax=Purpureocillium lilacinum TaxID=33203 RepID=A0A179HZR2_PURLI|nr:integral membrane protein [Purpureocillium lilacinum]OAQ95514.1 integral membrane protein [Purpureocillium lilacinum]